MKTERVKRTPEERRRLVRRVLLIIPASALHAVAFNGFYAPNHIAYGGITGVAQAINAVFGWPGVGALVILFNIPLFLLAWRHLGGTFLLESLFAMALGSVFIDVLAAVYTFPPMDLMLASIFGGVLLGLAIGLIMRQGATTGGTSVLARLIKLKFPWISMGNMQLITDLVVIAGVAVVFREVYSALYGLISLYISTVVMDMVLYGPNKAKFAYIISSRADEIAGAITHDLLRGVTLLPARGAFTGQERTILLCAFKSTQIVHLKQMVTDIDPMAFIIVCEAYEVLGEGFSDYRQGSM